MLTSLRTTLSRGIGRWVLIALMSVLILAFGFWGIQDVFRGFRSTEVASVGSTSISEAAFQRNFNQTVQLYSQQLNQVLTTDQARALGLDKQVLDRMTGDAALDQQASNYGLGLAPADVATIVMRDPDFQNGGRFDHTLLESRLQRTGLTEAGYIAEQREVYLRAQLDEAVGGEPIVPAVLAEAVTRFSTETRSISYVTLNDSVAGTIGAPDPAALSKFFEERKSDFRAPEYRKFTYMTLTSDMLISKQTVSDDDARATYDSQKDRYTTPEKRTVQRIAFKDDNEAKAAAARIASKQATFDTIAAERKLSPTDLDLGTMTRAEILDSELAKAAFSLAEGQTSGVVAGQLSTVILRVTKIQPEVVQTFDSVKAQIKTDIGQDRAKQGMLDVEGKIEDARAGGATLKEIAPKFGLKAVEIAAMDASGRDAAGQPYELPQQADLTKDVFSTDPGVDTNVIDGRDAGFVWYEVNGVTPTHDRTLDQAKGEVVAAWTAGETAKRLSAKANDMLKALRDGQKLDDVAKAAKLDVSQAWNLKRGQADQGLSTSAIAEAFATQKNGFGTTLSGSGHDRVVFQMTDSSIPSFDPANADVVALTTQLGTAISQELTGEYTARLKTDLGLTINQDSLNRATGVGGGDT